MVNNLEHLGYWKSYTIIKSEKSRRWDLSQEQRQLSGNHLSWVVVSCKNNHPSVGSQHSRWKEILINRKISESKEYDWHQNKQIRERTTFFNM